MGRGLTRSWEGDRDDVLTIYWGLILDDVVLRKGWRESFWKPLATSTGNSGIVPALPSVKCFPRLRHIGQIFFYPVFVPLILFLPSSSSAGTYILISSQRLPFLNTSHHSEDTLWGVPGPTGGPYAVPFQPITSLRPGPCPHTSPP